MASQFREFMAQATRLTRSGDVAAATAMIQEALRQRTFAADATPAACGPDDADVIDVEARVVADRFVDVCPLLPAGGSHGSPGPGVHAPEDRAGRRDDAAPASPGRFESGRFGQGRAARDFKLFVPPGGAAGQARPLVVMLHGCTQDPDDFAAGTRMNELARAQGFYVLYPAQCRRANPQGCWNWFKAGHQQAGRGEPATLAAMTRQVVAEHGIDPSRVYVAGLSAGGAMAAILGRAFPDLFAAVGVHSGLPPGAATDLPAALAAMQGRGDAAAGKALPLPTIVFHGDADTVVHARNGQQLFALAPGEPGSVHGETLRREGPGPARAATRHRRLSADGRVVAEHWVVHGAGHAWSGGDRAGSYADPDGPNASAEMLRFFLSHRLAPRG